MNVSKPVLFSVVLLAVSTGLWIPYILDVKVVNLPVDEEGYLKVTTAEAETSKIIVVYNESLAVLPDPFNLFYLTAFNTSGFKYAYIMAKAQGTWQEGAEISIYAYDNNFGIQTIWKSFELQTGSTYLPSWGSGVSGKYELHSTSIDLYLRFYNSNVGFDGLLTIVVYLTN